jgi:hypothetical protein
MSGPDASPIPYDVSYSDAVQARLRELAAKVFVVAMPVLLVKPMMPGE